MKKLLSIVLALTMVLSLAACGGNDAGTTTGATENTTGATENTTGVTETTAAPTETAKLEGTMEELLNKVIEVQPVEFMGGVLAIDLADTTEDGLWAIKSYTGLDNADSITEAAVYEPMMGSIPFSMVMVRVNEGADAKTVAEAMKAGIDQRKWICVEADDLLVAGYGDVVMLIMVGSDTGMTAKSFVRAFQSVVGADLEFTI